MKNEKVLNTIEEAIEDFRQGKIVIVVDDEDRENEGDFIIAAEKVTPEIVNFMLKNGRGVLCAPLSEERCAQLELNMMEPNNTSLLGTPFTVTVDLLGEGCTTGVSIHDRAATLRALADPKTKPSDLGRPGHINPLRARQKGVLRRPGHTEAAVDLARLAGLQPAGALIEIMNEDGSMARLPQLLEVAEKYGLEMEVLHSNDYTKPVDIAGPAFRTLEQVIRDTFPGLPVSPYVVTGATDAMFYEPVCKNCIRFSPIIYGPEQLKSMHGLNENIEYNCLPGAVRFYRNLILAQK